MARGWNRSNLPSQSRPQSIITLPLRCDTNNEPCMRWRYFRTSISPPRSQEHEFHPGKISPFFTGPCNLSIECKIDMSLLDKILGRPLKSSEAKKEKLTVATGVPVLGLDALASTAYGPEA